MAIFDLVHVLAGYAQAAALGHHGEGAFEVAVPHGGAVAERAAAAAQEVKSDEAAVLKLGEAGVGEVAETGRNIGDVAEYPVQQIDKMAELGEEGAAVEGLGAFPAAGLVVARIAVPEAIQLHQKYLAQAAFVHYLLQPGSGGRVAILHHPKHQLARLQGRVHNGFGIGFGEGNGLFDHDVQAVAQAGHRLRSVQAVGRGHGENVGGRATLQVVFERRKEGHAGKLGGEAGLQVGVGINQCHQRCAVVARNQRGVAAANVAHAANDKADGRILHVVLISGRIPHGISRGEEAV